MSHLHMKSIPESETGNERIEKKDGAGKVPEGRRTLEELRQKWLVD